MRPASSDAPPARGSIAILPGVGASPVLDEALLSAAQDDLAGLPAGSGIGIVVWRAPVGDDRGGEPVRMRAGPGLEVHVVGAPDPGLFAALRVWSPGPMPPALLARLAAAVGAQAEEWAFPEDLASRAGMLAALTSASPPSIEEGAAGIPLASRLAALLATPALSPADRAKSRPQGRPWVGRLAAEGAELGRVPAANGAMRRLRVPWEQRRRHAFICGRTGSGKSELIVRLAADDLEEGRGLVLIDPHGDLADRVLGLIPKSREADVVLVEPCHPRSAAIPVLDPRQSPAARTAHLDDFFVEVFDNGVAALSSSWRRPAAFALSILDELDGVDPTLTALDQTTSSEDSQVRNGLQLALGSDHPLARRLAQRDSYFWNRGASRTAGLATSAGRNAFDHIPRWSLHESVANQGIVIVKLDVGRLGTTDASRFGRGLLRLLFNAVAQLGERAPEKRPQLSVIVDEAQLFSGGPVLGAMLSQMRKFGGALTLCSQAPSRLGRLLPDVLANCATVLAMQLPRKEAAVFAERCGDEGCARIASLPRFHALAMLDDGQPATVSDETRPLVIHPLPVLADEPRRRAAVSERARRRHGRRGETAWRGDLERFAALADRHQDLGGRRPGVWSPSRAALEADALDHLQACTSATLAGKPLPEIPAS